VGPALTGDDVKDAGGRHRHSTRIDAMPGRSLVAVKCEIGERR
jgi:hypothetical protein